MSSSWERGLKPQRNWGLLSRPPGKWNMMPGTGPLSEDDCPNLCRGLGDKMQAGGSLTCYQIRFPLKGINVLLNRWLRGQVLRQCALGVFSRPGGSRSSPLAPGNAILLVKCMLYSQSTNHLLNVDVGFVCLLIYCIQPQILL